MRNRPYTQPWHSTARELSARGLSTVKIGRILGKDQSTVQKFLNPYSYEKWKAWHRRKYADNPEYRQKKTEAAREQYRRKRAEQEDAGQAVHSTVAPRRATAVGSG